MPMFFPSVKFLAKMHKEYNLLHDYDFFSSYRYKKFKKSFLNKIINLASLKNGAPNPFDYENIECLKYRISKASRYAEWPIITYDSFDDLSNKLKNTDMIGYSWRLLEFNNQMKKESEKSRHSLIHDELHF
jgi:hypothetical protein